MSDKESRIVHFKAVFDSIDISDSFEEDLDELCRLRSEIAAGVFGENVSRQQTEAYKKALNHIIDDMVKKKKELYGKLDRSYVIYVDAFRRSMSTVIKVFLYKINLGGEKMEENEDE